MSYLVVHLPILEFCRLLLLPIPYLSPFYIFLIMTFVLLILLPLFNKLLCKERYKWMVGE